MDNKVYRFYTELPQWAKGVVIIGGLGITYVIGATIYKKLKFASSIKDMRDTIKEQEKETRELEQQGLRATFHKSQYSAWANQIKTQYDGCDGSFARPILQFIPPTWVWDSMWSRSGAMTANIMSKLQNNLDFLNLSNAYDIQTYDQCGLFTGDFTGTLQQAILDELDENERKAINEIISKKGITYRV